MLLFTLWTCRSAKAQAFIESEQSCAVSTEPLTAEGRDIKIFHFLNTENGRSLSRHPGGILVHHNITTETQLYLFVCNVFKHAFIA